MDTSQHYVFRINFPSNTNVQDCDWRLPMHPSGITFDLTILGHANNYEKRSAVDFGEDKGCVNSVYYTVNGKAAMENPDLNNNSQVTAVVSAQYPLLQKSLFELFTKHYQPSWRSSCYLPLSLTAHFVHALLKLIDLFSPIFRILLFIAFHLVDKFLYSL